VRRKVHRTTPSSGGKHYETAAERDLIAADNERRLALIAIYKALGGGWNISPPSSPALAWLDR
jgi:hypothetical protein